MFHVGFQRNNLVTFRNFLYTLVNKGESGFVHLTLNIPLSLKITCFVIIIGKEIQTDGFISDKLIQLQNLNKTSNFFINNSLCLWFPN